MAAEHDKRVTVSKEDGAYVVVADVAGLALKVGRWDLRDLAEMQAEEVRAALREADLRAARRGRDACVQGLEVVAGQVRDPMAGSVLREAAKALASLQDAELLVQPPD